CHPHALVDMEARHHRHPLRRPGRGPVLDQRPARAQGGVRRLLLAHAPAALLPRGERVPRRPFCPGGREMSDDDLVEAFVNACLGAGRSSGHCFDPLADARREAMQRWQRALTAWLAELRAEITSLNAAYERLGPA